MPAQTISPTEEKHLRDVIRLSKQSRDDGNHPFAALLVSGEGKVLMTAMNQSRTERDATGHAERVLMTKASQTFEASVLAQATMYTSAEPCAMCAGAVYWTGIKGVVYALSETRLKQMIGPHPENLTMDLPCRSVFAAGQRQIAVLGPALEDEALAVHEGFWT